MINLKIIKPRMKPMLIPFVKSDGSGILAGGFQIHISRFIKASDPEKFYSFLLNLNGANTVKDLSRKFKISSEKVKNILLKLQHSGLIFENNPEVFEFSAKECEYYNRNINFWSWIDYKGKFYNYWEPQYLLKNSEVLVLGAGGTGSNCAESLVRMGVGKITIVDGDKVELNNLNRQHYLPSDVGKNKAEVLAEYLRKVNPYVDIQYKVQRIVSMNSIANLGTKFDAVLDCIDEPVDITNALDSFTREYHIPWFLGSYASTILNTAFFDGTTKNYLDMVRSSWNSEYRDRMLGINKDWKWDNAVISPIAAIGGNICALMCAYYLTGLKTLLPGRVQHIDFFSLQDLQHFSYILSQDKTESYF